MMDYLCGRKKSVESARSRKRRKTVFEENKFYAATTLAGFGFIQRSNSRIEVIIWYLIIVSFSFITIQNVTDLTRQYLSQTTVTQVAIGRLNETYNLSSFKLRLRVGLPEFNNEFRLLYPLQGIEPGYSYNWTLEEEVTAALTRLNTKEKLLSAKWNYVLLPLLSQYGFFISACEYFNEYCNPNYHSMEEYKVMTDPAMIAVQTQVHRFLAHSRRLGISDQLLIDTLGKQLLWWLHFDRSPDVFAPQIGRFMGILPSYHSDSVLLLYDLQPDRGIGVGLGYPNGLCVRANAASLVDRVSASGMLGSNATAMDSLDWYKQIYTPQMMVQYGLDNRRNLKTNMHEISYWSVEVQSTFHSITNCQKNNTKHHCVQDCMAATIIRRCGCFPILVDSPKPSELGWCTTTEYATCLAGAQENIFNRCNSDCLSDCDIDFLDMRLSATVLKQMPAMELCLNVLQKEIPVFQEHYPQNFQNFLAELGGAVDFWLGASVLALIHMFVYLIKQLIYSCKGNTKTGSNVRKMFRNNNLMDTLLLPTYVYQTEEPSPATNPRVSFAHTNGVDPKTEIDNSQLLQTVYELKETVSRLSETHDRTLIEMGALRAELGENRCRKKATRVDSKNSNDEISITVL